MKKYWKLATILSIFLMGISYALFSRVFVIEGQVTLSSDFDVSIASTQILNEVNSNGSSSIITNNGHSLSILTDLEYPGAYVEIELVIENNSNVNIELTDMVITGDIDEDIIIEVIPSLQTGQIIPTYGNLIFIVRISWDSDSSVSSKTVDFSLEFMFEQSI